MGIYLENQMNELVFKAVSTVAGLAIAVLGWFVAYRFGRLKELELKRISHLKSQIDEYYGPIYGLRVQSRTIHQIWKKLTPRDPEGNVEVDRLEDKHHRYNDFLVHNYFMPINSEIASIIKSKIYLQREKELSPSFQEFLDHQTKFEFIYRLKKETGYFTDEIEFTRFPVAFDSDVETTLNELKDEYFRLINNKTNKKRMIKT